MILQESVRPICIFRTLGVNGYLVILVAFLVLQRENIVGKIAAAKDPKTRGIKQTIKFIIKNDFGSLFSQVSTRYMKGTHTGSWGLYYKHARTIIPTEKSQFLPSHARKYFT